MTTVPSAEKQGHPEEGPHGRPCRHACQQSDGQVLHHAVEGVPLNDHLVGAWETGAEDGFIQLYSKYVDFALQAVKSKTPGQTIFLSGLYPGWLYNGVLQLFILYLQYT